jgi:anaerobic selenocysteine-containing dehydrogenase
MKIGGLQMDKINLSRRSFLKFAGAATAVAGIYSSADAAEDLKTHKPYTEHGIAPVPNNVVTSGCAWCQNACSMKVHVQSGRIVNIYGNPDDPVTNGRLCPKGQSNVDMLYNKYRLKAPLKRIGPRGKPESYQEISWDQALTEIAEKLKMVKEKYGPETLAWFVGGRSESQARAALTGTFEKLYGTPHREGTGPFCNFAGTAASNSILGHNNPPWIYTRDDFGGADWYMFVGSNEAACKPVIFGVVNDEKVKKRTKLIVVDPRMSETASRADMWLPIRPSTDMAPALSMMYHIIEKDLHNKDFIDKKVLGFDKLKAFLTEKKYTPEWAEKVTGIPAKTIKEISEEYAKTEKAIIMGNAGLSHHTNGMLTHRAFFMLAAITGHFGKPSMGYGCGNTGATPMGSISVPAEKEVKPKKQRLGKSPAAWIEPMITGKPYPIKAFMSCCNPLVQWGDHERIIKALDNLDLSVYYNMFPSVETIYFDYVLPVSPWAESGGVGPVSDERRNVFTPQIIQPMHQAKPERWIFIELGKKMGWGDIFKDEYKDPVALQRAMAKKTGFSPERFFAKKEGALRGPLPTPDAPEIGTLYTEQHGVPGKKGQFPRPSGKIEIWTEDLEKAFKVQGLSPLPEFYADPEIGMKDGLPYLEYIDNDTSDGVTSQLIGKMRALRVKIKYPEKPEMTGFDMYLTTGRPSVSHFGDGTHWVWNLQEQMPDQYCMIHPEKALEINVSNGDRVKIEGLKGYIHAKAWVYEGIRKDTVFVPNSYSHKQPFSQWKSINEIVDKDKRCPISDQTNYKGLVCKVTKA